MANASDQRQSVMLSALYAQILASACVYVCVCLRVFQNWFIAEAKGHCEPDRNGSQFPRLDLINADA